MEYSNKDHYLDKETGLLKNKLGLSDKKSLENYETECTRNRSYQLNEKPIDGNFDLDHLCAIHRHLFGDVYEWAGEIRDLDIAKNNSFFAHHAYIHSYAKDIFGKLAKENCLAGLGAQAFSERAAHYLSEINALHPFREGNGRTQREFINHLAYKNGYFIEWSGMSREAMLAASIESFHKDDNSLLAKLIGTNLKDLESVRSETKQRAVAGDDTQGQADESQQFNQKRERGNPGLDNLQPQPEKTRADEYQEKMKRHRGQRRTRTPKR